MFEPRPYQREAIDAGVKYFKSNTSNNSFEILPTGSGKSVIIANIAKQLDGRTIVFQPSKEILVQNLEKFRSYGYSASVYSASAGSKRVGEITFATIGSVVNKVHLFRDAKHIIVDECHLVNPKDGMYHKFITALPEAKVLGLTATPYRLSSSRDFGSMLKFLNRTRPRIFQEVLYYVQNEVLFNSGHLAKLEYFRIDVIDRRKLQMNTTGTDFTTSSISAEFRRVNMPQKTIKYANRLLSKRKNLLIFSTLIPEAVEASKGIPGSVVLTGETPQPQRDSILSAFKSGKIRCVINVGVLTTGFDFPELECVLLARSTMSLSLYYQMIGRGMRPHPDKQSSWIVDLGGNISLFGKIETMRIEVSPTGLYSIWNEGRQLTNITFSKN